MRSLLLLFLFSILTFCGDKKSVSSLRAWVLTWNGDRIEYKVVDFKYLSNVKNMDGSLASIKGHSVVDFDAEEGDLISGDPDKVFSRKGTPVNIDYIVDNGIIVAQNNDSIAMLSLYHDYEQIVDFWINEYQFTLKEIGKFNIHYDPAVSTNSHNFKFTATARLNAAYFPGLGDFLFFKTSPKEAIPIKMNAAILAHEFGHKIFDIRFANKDTNFTKNNSKAAMTQLKGINEGFADFASWLYIQKANVYIDSLNTKNFQDRSLPVSWTSSQLEKNPSICAGGFYCKGSILTSALYQLAKDPSMTNQEVGNATLNALIKFREDWELHKNDDSFDYYYLLNRIVNEIPASKHSLACSIFNKWFDDSVNSSGLKQVCI